MVVYRYITANSAEERMSAVANSKLKLERVVIRGGRFKNRAGVRSLTEEQLRELLTNELKVC